MEVKYKKTSQTAKNPTQGTSGAAGFDLYVDSIESNENEIKYNSGIAFEIPQGYCGLLIPRSSVVKTRLRMANSIGLIDSDYRGQVSGVFDMKDSPKYIYQVGDRFAQIVFVPIINNLVEVEKLSETERNQGSYGSTGV